MCLWCSLHGESSNASRSGTSIRRPTTPSHTPIRYRISAHMRYLGRGWRGSCSALRPRISSFLCWGWGMPLEVSGLGRRSGTAVLHSTCGDKHQAEREHANREFLIEEEQSDSRDQHHRCTSNGHPHAVRHHRRLLHDSTCTCGADTPTVPNVTYPPSRHICAGRNPETAIRP